MERQSVWCTLIIIAFVAIVFYKSHLVEVEMDKTQQIVYARLQDLQAG